MNKLISLVPIAAAMVAGQALADEPMPRATPTQHQSLKACIEKQKTADVNMSKSQMTRLCKDEIKREKAGDTPPPPSDPPRAP
jgi:hypothetical protein